MPYRPAAGITAVFLMLLQLMLAGGARACPRHEGASASRADVSSAPQSHGAHHHAGDGSEQPSSPTQHHPLPDCCPAMNACSNGVAIRSAGTVLTAGFSALSAPAYIATLFHSRVESPDPPPPKA